MSKHKIDLGEEATYLIQQFRVEKHMVQVTTDEGRYWTQMGWVVQGLSDGVHCYEMQGVFETEDTAHREAERLELMVDVTGIKGLIVDEEKWNYIGSSH